MKPTWRKAAVGTPAKQPIAVAVDQPPETSDDAVELEAWASMAAYYAAALVHLRGYRVCRATALLTCRQLGESVFERRNGFQRLQTSIACTGMM